MAASLAASRICLGAHVFYDTPGVSPVDHPTTVPKAYLNIGLRLFRKASVFSRGGCLPQRRFSISSRRASSLQVHAMDASIGGGSGDMAGPVQVFPRLNVRDPYKRLGLDREASMEEVSEAHTYLCQEYQGHEKSVEAIEAAYDQILQQKLRERKGSKINLKANLKKKVDEGPGWLKSFATNIETPKKDVVVQRALLYILLAVWSVMNPADGGPAFQVAVALGATVYLLNDRLKSIGRAFMLGFGALIIGWVIGSIVVPIAPTFLIPRSMSLELTTSLISYVFLFFACTFLK